MTIEVKQLLIRSSVVRRDDDELGSVFNEASGDDYDEVNDIKAEILAECRQLIIDMLREERER